MLKRVIKSYFVWNCDKEEKWLNEMAAKGLSLVSVGFFNYLFDDNKSDEYTIRLELLDNLPSHPESQQYIRFVEETGAEYVGSVFRWVYFRKKKADGVFDLYSDRESVIKYLNRILSFLTVMLFIELSGSVAVMSSLHNADSSNIFWIIIGVIYVFIILMITYGICKISWKRSKIKKDRNLFE